MSALLKSEVYINEPIQEKERLFTEAEYLAIEKNSQNKLEFRNGKIYSMAGASFEHGLIAGNLNMAFKIKLDDNPCESVQDTLKVKNQKRNKGDKFYYIPDIIVECGDVSGSEYAKKPIIIVEVLSYSTREMDLTQKFYDYQQIKTLQEYVVIEQDDGMCVDVYRRKDNWEAERYIEGSQVEFQSINLTLPIEKIYKGVSFKRKIRRYKGLTIIGK